MRGDDEAAIFSRRAIVRADNGDFLVMSDNGYGAKANSADYVLAVYRLRPDFVTASQGTGTVGVSLEFRLSDPHRKVDFEIVADRETYPGSSIPVDPAIRRDRLLTGADFDVESFRRAPDGTFWFGDEFGPFLIHTDASGRVLQRPIPLPGVQSPDNPFLGSGPPNLPRSPGSGIGRSTSSNGPPGLLTCTTFMSGVDRPP